MKREGEAPQGWIITELNNIAIDISYGYTGKPSDQPIGPQMLRITDIQNNNVNWLLVPFCKIPNELKSKYLLKKGDLVFARTGTVGKSFFITGEVPEAIYASYLIRVRCSIEIISIYLSYYFKSPYYWNQITEFSSGIAQANISGTKLKNLRVYLAPLAEQKRITDKLNVLLARVNTCRKKLDRIPFILKRFRQAVLASATSGQLTEDWGDVRLSSQWHRVSLSEICLSITDGDHQAPPQTKHGIPFITISAINNGRLRIEKATRFVSSVYFEQMPASRKPEMGDILFSVTGSIGISALVDTSEPFIFQRHIAILKPDLFQISSNFLLYSLSTDEVKRQALSMATGTAQLTIPLSALKALIINIPEREKQDEIVSRIEALFAYADRLECRYKAAYAQVERLTPVLLAKAFRGELVSQNPNDEPASVLLARIRSQREAKPTQTKRSQASRKSTMTKMTKESVKEVIRELAKESFSFDELYEKIPGDYNSLKDILFDLLNETEPILTQVFDQQERAMHFCWEKR